MSKTVSDQACRIQAPPPATMYRGTSSTTAAAPPLRRARSGTPLRRAARARRRPRSPSRCALRRCATAPCAATCLQYNVSTHCVWTSRVQLPVCYKQGAGPFQPFRSLGAIRCDSLRRCELQICKGSCMEWATGNAGLPTPGRSYSLSSSLWAATTAWCWLVKSSVPDKLLLPSPFMACASTSTPCWHFQTSMSRQGLLGSDMPHLSRSLDVNQAQLALHLSARSCFQQMVCRSSSTVGRSSEQDTLREGVSGNCKQRHRVLLVLQLQYARLPPTRLQRICAGCAGAAQQDDSAQKASNRNRNQGTCLNPSLAQFVFSVHV